MNIALRVDASQHIGTGHVMRCLTLAEELRAKGCRVVFICREHPGHLCDMVAAQGFEVARLKSGRVDDPRQEKGPLLDHSFWLGASQSSDASETRKVLQDNAPWDWIIVDHYALDSRWETSLRTVADRIMVLDDLADRKHACDLLLDQNFFPEPETRYEDLLPEGCITLFGPEYALLRPEFRQARKFCRMRGNGMARVLIYFGGNDPDNLTSMTLAVFHRQELQHLLVDVVVGHNNPHLSQLEQHVRCRPKTRLYIQPESFVELMLRADFCIGAGGSTTWERLCLGLPSLVISTATNQIAVSQELHDINHIYYLGNMHTVAEDNIFSGIAKFLGSSSINSFNFFDKLHIDGYGSTSVARILMER